MREKGCRSFLKKLCLFLDWKVKESWREASSEEFHGVKVILGQGALGESHMKELFIKWLSYDTTVSSTPVGTGIRQCIKK